MALAGKIGSHPLTQDLHDAVGGLLLVAGLADECSGGGITDAEKRGLVWYGGGRWEVTPLGRSVLPEIQAALGGPQSRTYSDASRLHWYALPADRRRGSLEDGTAEYSVLTTGALNGPREWRKL